MYTSVEIGCNLRAGFRWINDFYHVAVCDLCDVIRRLLIALLMASPLPIHAQVSEQMWVEGDVYAWLSRSMRVLGQVQTVQDQLNGDLDLYAGGFVDFGLKPILRERLDSLDWDAVPMDYLRLRLGVVWVSPFHRTDAPDELRLVADLTPRFRLWQNILVALRNRTEYRFVDGDFSFRYRPRIWVERTFYDVMGIPITPYISTELFYDSRFTSFARLRSLAGCAFAVTSWFAPEVSVVLQRDWVGDRATVFATDFIFAFYL